MTIKFHSRDSAASVQPGDILESSLGGVVVTYVDVDRRIIKIAPATLPRRIYWWLRSWLR